VGWLREDGVEDPVEGACDGAFGRQVDELRTNALCGTPDELVDRLGEFADGGASRMYLQTLDLADLDHLALIGEEVLPRVAAR